MATAGATAAGDLVTVREPASRAPEGIQAVEDSLPLEHPSRTLCTQIQPLIQRATTAEQASALAQRKVVALRESAATAGQAEMREATTEADRAVVDVPRADERKGSIDALPPEARAKDPREALMRRAIVALREKNEECNELRAALNASKARLDAADAEIEAIREELSAELDRATETEESIDKIEERARQDIARVRGELRAELDAVRAVAERTANTARRTLDTVKAEKEAALERMAEMEGAAAAQKRRIEELTAMVDHTETARAENAELIARIGKENAPYHPAEKPPSHSREPAPSPKPPQLLPPPKQK